MITLEDIQQALMDPSERGTRAIGRALVLLYSKRHNGQHTNPLGVAMARYFLNNNTLQEGQVNFWRKPLRDGTPHILKHAEELLLLAQLKEQRRFAKFNDMSPELVQLLNERNDLLEIVQDLQSKDELDLLKASLFALRKFERKHQMPGIAIPNIDPALEDEVRQELHDAANPKQYLAQSNGT